VSRAMHQAAATKRRATALRLSMLSAVVAAVLVESTAHAAAAAIAAASPPSGSVSFDADFFPTGSAPKVDLSRFEKDNVVLPGTYHGDIFVNRERRARADIVFASAEGSDEAFPCFDATMLASYGIDTKKLTADPSHSPKRELPEGRFCGPLGDYIPGAEISFDQGEQTLTLSVPQIYMSRAAAGYVDPSQWDAGINAAVFGYNTNIYRTRGQTQGFLGLNASMNFGSWHAVHTGAMSWRDTGGIRYQNNASYVQHDIPSWRAQLVAGDAFTSGEFFDSVRVRGVRLFTDERMWPQSQRGYAPVVHGVAETNAHVTIRQRGYIIYDMNVAPGPFVIDDLYPTGFGGDLDVQVEEADGRIRRFSVPFSSVPGLLRPGQQRWSLTAGQVEQQNLIDTPAMVQGTYQYGVSNGLTAYTGATLAEGYRAVLAGAAFNTRLGAFSTDLTRAHSQTPGLPGTQGWSLRLGYNKNLISTGTNFAVAAYRYSTDGFIGLNDAVAIRDAAARGRSADSVLRQRNRLDVSINQDLGDNAGQLYVMGSARNYWNNSRQIDFTAGYSNRWRSLSYSLSAQRSTEIIDGRFRGVLLDRIPGDDIDLSPSSRQTRRDTRFMLTFSLPMGKTERAPMLTAVATRSSQGGSDQQVSISGQLDRERRVNYGATVAHTGGNTMLSLNSQYNGGFGNVSANYGQGSGYRQFGAGLSGSIVVHRNGAVFSPPTGDTIGLVHVPGGQGARIVNGQGATIDVNGYGVVPFLQPYLLNTVEIDPKNTTEGFELKTTQNSVAPRAGSVVLLKYETSSGRLVFIDAANERGAPLAFGADVTDEQGRHVGVVGQASRLVLRDLAPQGRLTVRWGEGAAASCKVDYQLPQEQNAPGVPLIITSVCRATGDATAQLNRHARMLGSVGDSDRRIAMSRQLSLGAFA
jgi:outer membrane usher protein